MIFFDFFLDKLEDNKVPWDIHFVLLRTFLYFICILYFNAKTKKKVYAAVSRYDFLPWLISHESVMLALFILSHSQISLQEKKEGVQYNPQHFPR